MKNNNKIQVRNLQEKQHIPCRNYASDRREETGLSTIGFSDKTKNPFLLLLYSVV